MKRLLAMVLFASAVFASASQAEISRLSVPGEMSHIGTAAVRVVSSSAVVPVEDVPYVDIFSGIIPGEGSMITAFIQMSFIPSAPVQGWVEWTDGRGPVVEATPAVLRLEEKGESEVLQPLLEGVVVEPVALPLALASEPGIGEVVIRIPHPGGFIFEARLQVEIQAFEYWIDACIDEQGLVDVTWQGVSISADVPSEALVHVNGRQAVFPVSSEGGYWAITVHNFSQEIYEAIFVDPEGFGVVTFVTLDGDIVEQEVWFPPYEELWECSSDEEEIPKG